MKYRKVNLGEAFCLFIFFHSPHSLFNGLNSFLVQGKQRIALGYDLYMVRYGELIALKKTAKHCR